MQFISNRHLFFLLISVRLSVSWLYNLQLCLSTYFAVDVLNELSMVVSFIIMPSWRVNICLYSQLQNAVCFSLVVSLFQKYLVGTNCIHFCMTRCSVQASVGNCQLFYCGTSKPALEIIGGLMVK